jgi:hypothetical protein
VIQQISEKEYVFTRKLGVLEKENESLRGRVNVDMQIIAALNRQLDLLGERERESGRPRREEGFLIVGPLNKV